MTTMKLLLGEELGRIQGKKKSIITKNNLPLTVNLIILPFLILLEKLTL